MVLVLIPPTLNLEPPKFEHSTVLAITPPHQQNTHDSADGRKNVIEIFNHYVCSASHMHSGLHFQNV